MRKKTFVTVFAGALCTVGLGAAVALAATTDDVWGTGQANQAWTASSTNFVFSSSFSNNTCTNDSASGTTTGANPDAGLLNMGTPTFASCNNPVSTNSTNGSWQIAFWSDAQPSACPTSVTTDESSTALDCVQIQIPKAGATINFGICTVTIAPTAAASVYGKVTENSPTGQDTIAISNQSVPTSGCGVSSGTVTGNYTLNAVNGSYLDDFSGTDDGSVGSDGN